MKKKILLLNFIFICFYISSQNKNCDSDILTFHDNVLKQENLNINRGKRYVEKFRSTKNTNHFLENNFIKGSIVYDNQTYYNIPIKYDLLSDCVITKINKSLPIIHDTDRISKFKIKKRKFTRIGNTFFEVLEKSKSIFLLKKHNVTSNKIYRNKTVLYKFKRESSYYLLKGKKLTKVNTKKEWIKLYPSKKDKIKSIFNLNSNRSNQFYTSLFLKLK